MSDDTNSRPRRYLKRKDWADPDRRPDAEINKSTKKLSPRVSEDHLRAFNDACEHFPDKRAALEEAVRLLAESVGVPAPQSSIVKSKTPKRQP